MLQPHGRIGALRIPTFTRRNLRMTAGAALLVTLIPAAPGAAWAQQRGDEREPAQDAGQVDPVTGKVCRPMCAEDMSPCDPPIMKAREGRCSSPSAGFVG